MLNLYATVAYLAAEGGDEPEGIDLVLPATDELIIGIIAFGIVFFAVWRWLLPSIQRSLDARRDAITGQLTEAEGAKAEAESLLADYRQQLAEARTEANRIVEEARRSAESVKGDIVAKAEAEASEITRKAREDATAEKERATAAIRNEVAALSVAMAQKAVAGTIDEGAQRALVDRYLADLDGMAE
jgi:F-type H+-transporting ATPase subunit b